MRNMMRFFACRLSSSGCASRSRSWTAPTTPPRRSCCCRGWCAAGSEDSSWATTSTSTSTLRLSHDEPQPQQQPRLRTDVGRRCGRCSASDALALSRSAPYGSACHGTRCDIKSTPRENRPLFFFVFAKLPRFLDEKTIICQDRLGTDISKTFGGGSRRRFSSNILLTLRG
eukprot:COSAG06_NODE_8979_length_2019_cov_2.849479_2_plen_171_part_00